MMHSPAAIVLISLLILSLPLRLYADAESDYALGVEAYKAGDNEAAASYFESARRQGMESVALDYNLASSYYRLGKYQQSRALFEGMQQVEAMRDIVEYHLGLIALQQNDRELARGYFRSVAERGSDKRLAELSGKHLDAMSSRPQRWKSFVSANVGHDDNISSVADDSVLNQSDSFYDVFVSADLLLAGQRKHGWLADAYVYAIDYLDSDIGDESRYAAGIKYNVPVYDWSTSSQLSLSSSSYGGEDLQSIAKLDIKVGKAITRKDKIQFRFQYEDINSDNALYDYLEGWRQRSRATYKHYSTRSITQLYYELELNERGMLVTTDYAYEYSPTRHSLRGIYTYMLNPRWWLSGDLVYRNSDYPVSATVDRNDDQWRLTLTSDYYFDRTFKLSIRYQDTDNTSSESRYDYDKSVFRIGLSKLF